MPTSYTVATHREQRARARAAPIGYDGNLRRVEQRLFGNGVQEALRLALVAERLAEQIIVPVDLLLDRRLEPVLLRVEELVVEAAPLDRRQSSAC